MDERETMGHEGGSDRGAAGKAKEKARKVTDQAREKVSHAASEARDRSEDLVEEGKEKARELGDRATEAARDQASDQKGRVTDGIRSVADALHRGARELPEDQRQYGRFLDGVADRVEGVSRYLEERDVDTLTRDVRRFARDHAPVFLSGAFTLGMLGARFLKSSPDEAHQDRYGGGTLRSQQRYAGYPRDDRFGRYEATPGTAGAERTEGMAAPRPTGPDRSEGIREGDHA